MKTLNFIILTVILSLQSVAQVKHNSENLVSIFRTNNADKNNKSPSGDQATIRQFDSQKRSAIPERLKSATGEKQRLDSIIYRTFNMSGEIIENMKRIFAYNSSGKQLCDTLLRWNDQANKWENLNKTEFIHNSEGNVVNETLYTWNNNESDWSKKTKYDYDYDSNGNLILDANYFWIGSSEIWRGIEKRVSAFNSYGNKILDASYEWDNYSNDWKGKEKYEFAFDESGNKTMEAYFIWDYVSLGPISYGWVNQYLHESLFDENNKPILITESVWSPDSTILHKQTKKEFIYDSDDSISQSITYNWIELDNDWKQTEKEEFIYTSDSTIYKNYIYDFNLDSLIKTEVAKTKFNANGKISTKIKYYRSNQLDSIVPDTKVEYTYHSPGNQTFETFSFNFDIDSESWIPSQKMEYTTYDENGNPTQIIESSNWDNNTEGWSNIIKLKYAYNSKNEQILFQTSTWDKNLNDWVGFTKYEYVYDENNNQIIATKYIWDSSLNDWKGDFMQEYIFDESYSYSDLTLPYLLTIENFQNMLTHSIKYGWDDNENDFYEKVIDTYYYSSTIVDKIDEKLSLNSIKIYPNPAKKFITISNMNQPAKLELYSVNGNKIKTIQVMVNTPVSVTFLPPGAYIYKLFTGEKFQSGTIIKK